MKVFTQIEFEIDILKRRLTQKEIEHSNLCQIDMLSSTGSQLREEINKIQGNLTALHWVANDNINGDIYPI